MEPDLDALRGELTALADQTRESLVAVADRFGLGVGRLAALLGTDAAALSDPGSWDGELAGRLAATEALSEFLVARIDVDGTRDVIDTPAHAFDGATLFEVLAADRCQHARAVYEAAFGLRPPLQTPQS